jgi:hypothetical protein
LQVGTYLVVQFTNELAGEAEHFGLATVAVEIRTIYRRTNIFECVNRRTTGIVANFFR